MIISGRLLTARVGNRKFIRVCIVDCYCYYLLWGLLEGIVGVYIFDSGDPCFRIRINFHDLQIFYKIQTTVSKSSKISYENIYPYIRL